MDKRTYEELMNYLVKVECKRIEKDRITGGSQAAIQNKGFMQKRPSST